MNGWMSLLDALQTDQRFSSLLRAIEQTQLTDLLKHQGPLTLLAPTDKAFEQLPPEMLETLFHDPKALEDTLRYHLLQDTLTAAQLIYSSRVTTMLGRSLTCVGVKHAIKVNYAQIEQPDRSASNGQLHVIDTVLLPVALQEPAPPADLLSVEEWLPYKAGTVLPIGDAQLVPSDPAIRESVKQFTDILVAEKVSINTARTVRLSEDDTVSTRAPRGPSGISSREEFYSRAKSGLIIGVRRLDGNIQIDPGPGSYVELLQLESEDKGVVALLDANKNPVKILQASIQLAEKEDPTPSAAIFYGTTMCQHSENDVTICCDCGWWDVIAGTPRCGEA